MNELFNADLRKLLERAAQDFEATGDIKALGTWEQFATRSGGSSGVSGGRGRRVNPVVNSTDASLEGGWHGLGERGLVALLEFLATPEGQVTAERVMAGLGAAGGELDKFVQGYMRPAGLVGGAIRRDPETLMRLVSGGRYEPGDVTGSGGFDFAVEMALDPTNWIPGGAPVAGAAKAAAALAKGAGDLLPGLAFIAPNVLRRMGLGKSGDEVVDLVNAVRQTKPDLKPNDLFHDALFHKYGQSQNFQIGDVSVKLNRSHNNEWIVDVIENKGAPGSPEFIDFIDTLTRAADASGVTLRGFPYALGSQRVSTEGLYHMYNKLGFELDRNTFEMVRKPMPLDESTRLVEAEARRARGINDFRRLREEGEVLNYNWKELPDIETARRNANRLRQYLDSQTARNSGGWDDLASEDFGAFIRTSGRPRTENMAQNPSLRRPDESFQEFLDRFIPQYYGRSK